MVNPLVALSSCTCKVVPWDVEGWYNLSNVPFVWQVTVPSLASVFNEYALKSQFDTSVHLQVFFFYILSVHFFWVTLVACWNILRFFFVFMLLTLYNLAYKVVKLHVLYLFWSLRSFSWIALQNLFLYGYGALFNLLAILCTAIYQGTYFWFCLMVSVCSWGLQPHLGFSGLKWCSTSCSWKLW